jgi:hypothetical protein
MWESRSWEFLGDNMTIFRSSWQWKPWFVEPLSPPDWCSLRFTPAGEKYVGNRLGTGREPQLRSGQINLLKSCGINQN